MSRRRTCLLRPNQGDESGGGTHRIVLADLGLAKRAAEASGLTQAVGTPSYMAPEQGRGDGGFDERADIYAVGAVAYALLTGHPPYSAGSITEVLNRDPDLPPPSLRPTLHDSVGQLDDLFARTLAYHVGDRWERADTLAERLEAEAYRLEQEAPLRALERTHISDPDEDIPTTVATDPPVRRRRATEPCSCWPYQSSSCSPESAAGTCSVNETRGPDGRLEHLLVGRDRK